MARKFEELSLKGVEGTFVVTQLSPTRAYYLLLDLIALVAPSAAKGLGGAQDFDFGKLDVSQLGQAFESLFSRANRDEVKRITKELFSGVEFIKDGSKQPVNDTTIDFIFAGNPLGIFELQKETLRVNFSDFFNGLVERARPLLEKAKSKSKESPISSGQSGGSSPTG